MVMVRTLMAKQGSFTDTDRGHGIRQAIFKFSGTLGFHFFQDLDNSPHAFNFIPDFLQAHLAASHLAGVNRLALPSNTPCVKIIVIKLPLKSPQRNNRMFSQPGGLWA